MSGNHLPSPVAGTKRSEDVVDLLSSGDISNALLHPQKKKKDTTRRVTSSPTTKSNYAIDVDSDDDDIDDDDDDDLKMNNASLKDDDSGDSSPRKRKAEGVIDLQSSSDEDTSDGDDAGFMKKMSLKKKASKSRKRAAGSSSNGWITWKDKDDTSSSSSDSEEDDEDDRMLEIRCHWLTSDSRDEKLAHLDTIPNDEDKALQMLLWDVGCDYNIFLHQFAAIKFCAGYIPSFPRGTKDDSDSDSDDSGSDEEDETLQEMLQRDIFGEQARFKALSEPRLRRDGRGMLLADEMGLGKTIESLAGAVLRNAAAKKTNKKPTLIVCPQDGVMCQWHEALQTAGIESARIRIIGEKKSETKKRVGKRKDSIKKGEFVLLTRYHLQSEMKRMFEYNSVELKANKNKKESFFKSVPTSLIKKLKNQYNAAKGNERNQYSRENEPRQDCVTRLIREVEMEAQFETVIVDESHFLRNILAFWGIGAALLGAQSKRTVLLSGTPYNNSHRDMAAMMTIIDPSAPSAKVGWWKKAVEGKSGKKIAEAVGEWRSAFMLRRTKDVLDDKLPPRTITSIPVSVRPSDLRVYDVFEASFLNGLRQLKDEVDEGDIRSQREIMQMVMSCSTCMRMSLIHSVLPKGREASIGFAGSRKKLISQEQKKDTCVLCGGKTLTQKVNDYAAKLAGNGNTVKEEGGGDQDFLKQMLEDEMTFDDAYASLMSTNTISEEDKEKGTKVELSADLCRASGTGCCHFAHEKCIELYCENESPKCPRCSDLASRLHFDEDRKVYCQDVENNVTDRNGFTASSKVDAAIKWIKGVPEDDKMVIFSFFCGSLDLVEGTLNGLGIKCCRYDGDLPKQKREKELKRFQKDASYRVLLMSVQSGGVGLNITQANWMLGLDRWFNPQVHDQAEFRCHRIGQTKPVNVSYLDASCTIDDVMKKINQLKEANADLVLADGKSIGIGSTINYYQLVNGILGELVKSFQQLRLSMIAKNAENGHPDAPLVFNGSEEDLERKLQEMRRRSMTAIKNEESSDEDDDDDADDNRSSTNSRLSISHADDSQPKSKKSSSSPSDEDEDDSNDELFSDSKLMFPSALTKTDKKGAKSNGVGNAKSSPSPKGINDVIELLSDDDEMSADEDFEPSPTKQRAVLVGKFPPASLSSKDKAVNEDGGDEQLPSSTSGEGGKVQFTR